MDLQPLANHLFITLSTNISWTGIGVDQWPAGGVEVFKNVTLSGLPGHPAFTEINFMLTVRFSLSLSVFGIST